MDRRTAGHNATRVKPVPLDSHHPFLPSFPSLVLRSSIPRSLSRYCIAEDQVWFAVGFAVLRFLWSTIAVFFICMSRIVWDFFFLLPFSRYLACGSGF